MNRLFTFDHLKWLYPGMHIKRWLGLMVIGVAILAFVVYHLMHLTWGTVHPSFVAGDAYNNFVSGFRVWPVSVGYILAMGPLGLHLYHGVWSALQTLGVSNPGRDRWRRVVALAIALLVAGGNCLFPLAVLAGVLR